MGTEIRSKGPSLQEIGPASSAQLQEREDTLKKEPIVKKCICGCNAPMLYAKRNCDIPYSTARENFKAILHAFFKQNQPPVPTSEARDIDIYDLFHIILKVKGELGRVSWRRVSKALGVPKSTSSFRRPLRRFYKAYLRSFEDWLRDKGPVSIGCIDTSLVIIILKEFLPSLKPATKTEESETSAEPSPHSAENAHEEIAALVNDLIADIEAGKVVIKKRKLAEPPDFFEELGVAPIFVIRKSEKTAEKVEKVEKVKKERKSEKREKIKKMSQQKGNAESTEKESVGKALDVVNPMCEEFRTRDPVKMGYRTDFRKGYLPIDMQEEHEKLEKIVEEKETKSHFIRKKQSAVNIKRSCGVTYVKPTESKQRGVEKTYDFLPPLAFQVGTVDRVIPQEERVLYFARANDMIKEIFESGKFLRVTVQQSYSEEDLKKYILGQKPDGDEIFVRDIQEIWRVLSKDNFVSIHFNSDDKALLVPSGLGQVGDCKLGFLVKNGLCGTRSVKRCLGLEEKEDDPLNMQATQIRLELYITKQLWKKALPTTRKLLCAFISEFEVFIQKMLNRWNAKREEIFKTKVLPDCTGLFQRTQICNCVQPVASLPVSSLWEYKSNSRCSISALCPICGASTLTVSPDFHRGLTSLKESKKAPHWYYLINTRDSFSYDLKTRKSYIPYKSRRITKKEYFFSKDDLPSNYKDWQKYQEGDLVRTGIVTFKNCFTHEDLLELEQDALATEDDFVKGHFMKNTAQPTYGAGGKIKRTKFFFGTRYMWTASQLAEKQSRIAAGVRVDVSSTPYWMKKKIEQPLVEAGVLEKDFINSIAMNIYHDGNEGLAQHFDDAVRFKQPIFTVKLDSDARLSFGSQFYGYLNGAFCIPCPRGVVCMMEEFSYAANSAKHCVRPCDLAGRSITIILRQIHPFIMEEARRYDEEVDLPTWMSTLSLDDRAVCYGTQKEMQAKASMKSESTPKASY